MNEGLDLQEGDGPFELDDDSIGTWIVVTEDAAWYLDLDKHFMVELHREEPDSGEQDADAPPRFRLDHEVFTIGRIVVCRVGQAFMVELVFGEPPRPRVALNKPVLAMIPAMSR